jgi:protein-tyrosine-phosphatase
MIKRVLFVCIENSNRSQIAEAFARRHGGPHIEAYSAGSRPSGKVSLLAVESMREIGYDLSQHKSKWAVPTNAHRSAPSAGKIGTSPTREACRRMNSGLSAT